MSSIKSKIPILHTSNSTLFQYQSITLFQSYTLPILHSSNPTLFQSYTLPILHSSNPTLFISRTPPILHSSNLKLFQSYTLLILHCSNLQGFQGTKGTNTPTHQHIPTLQHTNTPTHSKFTSLEKVWPTHLLTMYVDTRDPTGSKNIDSLSHYRYLQRWSWRGY